MVHPFVYRPAKRVELRFGVEIAEQQKKGDKGGRLLEPALNPTSDDSQGAKWTASETLAFLLRIALRGLKYAEKSRKAAPVRSLKLLPRSLIAEIAMDLLQSCETWGRPPGPKLNDLVHELLNLERDSQSMSRDFETQKRAAGIVAIAPKVRTRELARAFNVNASTISRWRRSSEFKQMVDQKTKAMKANADGKTSLPITKKELSVILKFESSLSLKSQKSSQRLSRGSTD